MNHMQFDWQQALQIMAGTGALMIIAQYFFPSLAITSEANRTEIETEIESQMHVLSIADSWQAMAMESAEREKAHLKMIQDNRDHINKLHQDKVELLEIIAVAKGEIAELRQLLEIERSSTKTMPYVRTLVEIYDIAKRTNSDEIVQKIKDFADRRIEIKDAIT